MNINDLSNAVINAIASKVSTATAEIAQAEITALIEHIRIAQAEQAGTVQAEQTEQAGTVQAEQTEQASTVQVEQTEQASTVQAEQVEQDAIAVVHEYVRSSFGNIITLPQYDTFEAPVVDLDDPVVQDALDLDRAFSGKMFFVNVYRRRVANKGDRLGTNGYVLGEKLFSSEEEAYRRRMGRLGKDAGYEGVISITLRQARDKGYAV